MCAFEVENAETGKTADDADCVYREGSGNHKQFKTVKSKQIRFLLDSGATEHDKMLFGSFENTDTINISIAKKREVLKSNQQGDIAIKIFFNNDCLTRILKNVLFVKNLNFNR